MSNKNDQNSLQPSLSGCIINENCNQICRDFIWGLCNKQAQCKYRHELDFEAMKKTLKFCHDYQNPSGCMRDHCTYLHTSKEEESLFFAIGTLPRVLAERHANITAASAEILPQTALFIQESVVGAPPPPSAAKSSPLNSRSASMPLQQLPPPPPPPPPPPNTTSANTILPIFTVPPPQPTPAFSITRPPPPLPVFDASRPPPPIPTMVQPINSTQKRQTPNDISANKPSKLRKTEEPKHDDALCDVCVQREIRIEKYRQEMEKMSSEDEYQTLLYKKKLMEYQKQTDILRKLINSDYKFVQEFLDDVPQYSFREPLSNLNPSFLSGMATTGSKHNQQQFLLQFMEYMISNTRNFESSSVRVEESLRTLSTTPRRTSHQTPDILQTLKEIMGHDDFSSNCTIAINGREHKSTKNQKGTSSERSVSGELRLENAQNPGANGVSSYRHYSNGQRVEQRPPPPPAPPLLPAPVPPPPAPVAPPAPPPAVAYPHYTPQYLQAPRAPATRAPLPPYYHYQ